MERIQVELIRAIVDLPPATRARVLRNMELRAAMLATTTET